jgi:hypothetical protein
MRLEKYSFGIGDRFAREGKAQLEALLKARKAGIPVMPVWNKSHREHQTVGSSHMETRQEADEAVRSLGWNAPWYVDADHINMSSVDGFMYHANFFTIDVADYIEKEASKRELDLFVEDNKHLTGELNIPGIQDAFHITAEQIRQIGKKYLFAIQQAGKIYHYICAQKGENNFVAEVSMDETNQPQSPVELLFILSALSRESVALQTLAPKFTGRFNKGVDYQGDLQQFEKEFEQDVLVLKYAVHAFNLPDSLKLSIHTGSDKFSLYPVIGRIIKKHDAGIHVKTAGTTWLEEAIGLCKSGDEGFEMVKDIYFEAFRRLDELTAAYSAVIDIDPNRLPAPEKVSSWKADDFIHALRHVPDHAHYNPHLRQLMHVAYKIAAEKKDDFLPLLKKYRDAIAPEVTENLWSRHLRRLFEI